MKMNSEFLSKMIALFSKSRMVPALCFAVFFALAVLVLVRVTPTQHLSSDEPTSGKILQAIAIFH